MLRSQGIKFEHLPPKSDQLIQLKRDVEEKYLEKISKQVEAQNKEYFENKAKALL